MQVHIMLGLFYQVLRSGFIGSMTAGSKGDTMTENKVN